jgi:NitT/TauT family transport system substrate-binding protein
MKRFCMPAIFLVLFFLPATGASASDKIRIGMPADAGHFTLQLAQKHGFLKEEGLEAEIITLTGPVANIALTSGDIDYYTGLGSSLRAMIQGSLPSRIVACYRPTPHLVLIGRPELKSVKDLKGKTMGGTPGTAPDLVGRIILKQFGLDPDRDMKFLRTTSDSAFARMQQGVIDAQTLPVPWDFRAKKLGLSILARAEELFTYPISGVVAHVKKIKDKPDEIKRLIKAGIKANRYMRANRDATIDTLAPTYKLDKETAAALYDSFVKGFNDDGSLPEDGLRQLVADTKTIMKIDREIALSEVMELSILRSAQRELGIK